MYEGLKLSPQAIAMMQAMADIRTQQAVRGEFQDFHELVAEVEQRLEAHEQWKREDNAWRIPLLHRAEIQKSIPKF